MSYPKIIGNKPYHRSLLMRKSPLVVVGTTLIKFIPILLIILTLRVLLEFGVFKDYVSTEGLRLAYRITCLLLIAESLRQYYNSIYILASKRLIQIDGFLSLKYLRNSIAYRDIRDLQLDQTIWGRIFNHGTIRCGTAAIKDHELVFTSIFRSHYIKNLIENKIATANIRIVRLAEQDLETGMELTDTEADYAEESDLVTYEVSDSID